MADFKVSLCILACDQGEHIARLIESIRAFEGLEVEVVIGDNSPSAELRAVHQQLADKWLRIEDRQLWFDGFAACKQSIVNAASHPWIIIADPDEVWEPRYHKGEGLEIPGWQHLLLLSSAEGSGRKRVARTLLVRDGKIIASHGRVFHRRDYRLMGLIHEELYGRRDRANWSMSAPSMPFAWIEHRADEMPQWYLRRKTVLYDNLLHRISKNPEMSMGTSSWWWTEYWPQRLEEGFEPTTFEEWSETYRGGDS